mmetsp:Transcript_23447/g.50688  ORF Transcript_23447/g.50688 Transcript_23447/m.50688 type:complete len:217 (-) Transcript_23447:94-744(-)
MRYSEQSGINSPPLRCDTAVWKYSTATLLGRSNRRRSSSSVHVMKYSWSSGLSATRAASLMSYSKITRSTSSSAWMKLARRCSIHSLLVPPTARLVVCRLAAAPFTAFAVPPIQFHIFSTSLGHAPALPCTYRPAVSLPPKTKMFTVALGVAIFCNTRFMRITFSVAYGCISSCSCRSVCAGKIACFTWFLRSRCSASAQYAAQRGDRCSLGLEFL